MSDLAERKPIAEAVPIPIICDPMEVRTPEVIVRAIVIPLFIKVYKTELAFEVPTVPEAIAVKGFYTPLALRERMLIALESFSPKELVVIGLVNVS